MADSQGKTLFLEGRIVWGSGDLFAGKVVTEFGTQIPKLNKQGQQTKQYGFGLAVPKQNIAEMWAVMHEEAYTLYPSRQLPPSFSMKYKDGDSIDDKGQPFSAREGYAGHLVFALTTSLPIKWYRHENGSVIQIADGVKVGDYVRAQVMVRAHGPIGQGKPGLYLNPMAVLFLGYGTEIVNAPSGDQVFGTQAPPLPPGASATPLGMQGAQTWAPPAPGASPQHASNITPPAAAYAGQPAPQVAQPQQQPYYNVLPPVHQPQQAPPAQSYAPPMPAPQQGAPVPQGPPPMPGVPQYPRY